MKRAAPAVPILLYHSVTAEPSGWIAGFNTTPRHFTTHLSVLQDSGRTPITVEQLCRARRDGAELPPRPVVITFDDGFEDTLTVAAQEMARRQLVGTVYLTSGFLGATSPGGDRMLSWRQARELSAAGLEVGSHTVTHPELDTLPADSAWREIRDSRRALQDRLSLPVDSFAYPHGYSSPQVRLLVARAGYRNACAVKNTHSGDDPAYTIARLTVTAGTTQQELRGWLAPGPHRTGQHDERPLTRGWRTYRRMRAKVTRVGGVR